MLKMQTKAMSMLNAHLASGGRKKNLKNYATFPIIAYIYNI